MQELQEMLAKGGKKLQDFVDDVWKKIADWFLKNKNLVSLMDEVDAVLLSLIKILRKNPKFLDSLEYIKLIGRPLGKWLALEQEAAINIYTKSYYIALNKALRKLEGIKMTAVFKAMQQVLDNALEKLPISKYNGGVLWRSARFTEAEIKKLFKLGKDFVDEGFFSTTHSEKALLRWMKNNPSDNVLFKVYGKSGKLIQESSVLPNEAEVLFKSKTAFVVESIRKIDHPIDKSKLVTEIILKEK